MVTNIRHMTVEEYLAFDDASEITNEYIDGEIIPMPGGTRKHNKLVANTIIALGNVLADRDCEVLGGHMRVRIDETKYVYPDVSVVCGDIAFRERK